MYHYDPGLALEELQEDALLPHPVKLRDMILRTKLDAKEAQLLNHDFQDYLSRSGERKRGGRGLLKTLAPGARKASCCFQKKNNPPADEDQAAGFAALGDLWRRPRARRAGSRKSLPGTRRLRCR